MKTPPVVREVLPCGLTVVVEPIAHVRSAALGFYLRSGSAAESAENSGASHFLEHLVFKGTSTRSTADIALVVDELGGDVDAFTGKEYTSFYAHVLDEQAETALDLLTDIVLNPRYTDGDMEMERSVILEEIKMVEDTPDDLVNEIFLDTFWPGHPLGRPILGTDETVGRLTRSNIEAHYAETFHPENMIFVASGNVSAAKIVKFLDEAFRRVDGTAKRYDWSTPTPKQHVVLRRKKELEQVHLLLGSRGLPQQSDARFAAAIYNAVLGGGMSSRLFQRVREKEGLAYAIASYHNGYLNGGYQAVYAATNPKNLKRLLDVVFEEMRLIRRDGATAEELALAKRSLKTSILLSLESTISRMSGIGRQEYYFGTHFSPDEIIGHIEQVTADDVREVASLTVDPESISLTLLGNMKAPGITVGALREALA
ncbi:MAG: pitrilysin family protein [Thermoanaerobaculia bacterium]|jgi:predicted Zn-dependent peptidase